AHANNASVTPGLPAGIQNGDILLSVNAIRSTTAFPNTSTQGYNYMGFPADPNVRVFGKIVTDVVSEVAPTISFSGGIAGDTTSSFIIALRGRFVSSIPVISVISDIALPIIGENGQSNGSAQDIAYPGLTIPVNSFVLYIGWKQNGGLTSTTNPGTKIIDTASALGNGQALTAAYQQNQGPTSIGSGSFVVTGGAAAISKGIVIALKPTVITQTLTISQRGVNGAQRDWPAGANVRLPSRRFWRLS